MDRLAHTALTVVGQEMAKLFFLLQPVDEIRHERSRHERFHGTDGFGRPTVAGMSVSNLEAPALERFLHLTPPLVLRSLRYYDVLQRAQLVLKIFWNVDNVQEKRNESLALLPGQCQLAADVSRPKSIARCKKEHTRASGDRPGYYFGIVVSTNDLIAVDPNADTCRGQKVYDWQHPTTILARIADKNLSGLGLQ
jgi:hypothetical protein